MMGAVVDHSPGGALVEVPVCLHPFCTSRSNYLRMEVCLQEPPLEGPEATAQDSQHPCSSSWGGVCGVWGGGSPAAAWSDLLQALATASGMEVDYLCRPAGLGVFPHGL